MTCSSMVCDATKHLAVQKFAVLGLSCIERSGLPASNERVAAGSAETLWQHAQLPVES
jgi:hypothetical protein